MNRVDTVSLSSSEPLWRALQQRSGDLVMLPAVAQKAVAVVQHPDCSVDQFVLVVGRDAKLATDLLALANSALFVCRGKATTLKEAVVRLGFRKCRNLILASSAASLMQSLPLQEEWVRRVLWQHSQTTATACVHLNRAFDLGHTGEEFTAGLLHDIGRLLLAIAGPDSFAEADPLDLDESTSPLDHEASILGVDHCQFGSRFAEESGLPEEFGAVIRYHHDVDAEQPFQKLTSLVAAADHLANYLQRSGDAFNYDAENNAGIARLSVLREEDLSARFVDMVPALIEGIQKDIGGGTAGRSVR